VEFPSSGALLELNDVHKSFGHTQVIKGVSLKVRKGEPRCDLSAQAAGARARCCGS